jgi:hypothetical protein
VSGDHETASIVGTPDGPTRRVSAALDALLGELGYTLVEDPGSDDLVRYLSDEGGWITLRAPAGIARALAPRLASRVSRTVHVFTATAHYTDPLQCAVDDVRVRPDGSATTGPTAHCSGSV